MAMVVNTEFDLKEVVYLVTDTDQFPRIVVGFFVSVHGVTYQLQSGTYLSEHYHFEISREKNVLVN